LNASNLICEQNDGDLCPGNMYKYCPLFASDEYVPALKADETRVEVIYEPTPKHILHLKTMAECQKSRIILNVGGSRFETCVYNFW
jgi:UV DNA damage repair endonuclease